LPRSPNPRISLRSSGLRAVKPTADQTGWSNESRNSGIANDVQRHSRTGIRTRTALRPEGGSSGRFHCRDWSRDRRAGIARRPRHGASTAVRRIDETPTGKQPFQLPPFSSVELSVLRRLGMLGEGEPALRHFDEIRLVSGREGLLGQSNALGSILAKLIKVEQGRFHFLRTPRKCRT
jgi:hypothetical protein